MDTEEQAPAEEAVETTSGSIPKQQRDWGMFCHLAAFAGYIIPAGGIIGPLIVWLIKKDEFPYVDEQGKESLNFQISIFIYTAVAAVSLLVVIGILLLPAVLVFNIVMIIIGSMKANAGEHYQYPLTIRIIK